MRQTHKERYSFEGGMNLDVSPDKLSDKEYRDAALVKLTGDGSNMSITTREGTVLMNVGRDSTSIRKIYKTINVPKFQHPDGETTGFAVWYSTSTTSENLNTAFIYYHKGSNTWETQNVKSYGSISVKYIDAVLTSDRGKEVIYWVSDLIRPKALICDFNANSNPNSDDYIGTAPTTGLSVQSVDDAGSVDFGSYYFYYRLYSTTNFSTSKWSLPSKRHVIGVKDKALNVTIEPTSEDVLTKGWDTAEIAMVKLQGASVSTLASTIFRQSVQPNTQYTVQVNDDTRLLDSFDLAEIQVDDVGILGAKAISEKNNRLLVGSIKYKDLQTPNHWDITPVGQITSSLQCPDEGYIGYFRGETYRFGIRFMDSEGDWSPVSVMNMDSIVGNTGEYIEGTRRDLTFPRANNSVIPLQDAEGNRQALKVDITDIPNIPSWATRYEIVRMARQKDIEFQALTVPSVLVEPSGIGLDYPGEGETLPDQSGILFPKDYSWKFPRSIKRLPENKTIPSAWDGDDANIKAREVHYYNRSRNLMKVVFGYTPDAVVENREEALKIPKKVEFSRVQASRLYRKWLKDINQDEANDANKRRNNSSGYINSRWTNFGDATTEITNLNNYIFSTAKTGYREAFLAQDQGASVVRKNIKDVRLISQANKGGILASTPLTNNVCSTGNMEGSLNEGVQPNPQQCFMIQSEESIFGDPDWFFGKSVNATIEQTKYGAGIVQELKEGEPTPEGDRKSIERPAGFPADPSSLEENIERGTPTSGQGDVNRTLETSSAYANANGVSTAFGVYNFTNGLNSKRYGSPGGSDKFISIGATSVAGVKEISLWGGDCFINRFLIKINDSHYRVANVQRTPADNDANKEKLKTEWGSEITVQRPIPIDSCSTQIISLVESVYFMDTDIDVFDIIHGAPNSAGLEEKMPVERDWAIYNQVGQNAFSSEFDIKVSFSKGLESSTDYPYRILFSDSKIRETYINGYNRFRALNFYDYDGAYGDITALENVGGKLIMTQESAISEVPVLEQVLETRDGGEMYTSSGQVLNLNRYISQINGCRDSNDFHTLGDFGVILDRYNKRLISIRGRELEYIDDKGIRSLMNDISTDNTFNIFNDTINQEFCVSYGVNMLYYSLKNNRWVSKHTVQTSPSVDKIPISGFVTNASDNSRVMVMLSYNPNSGNTTIGELRNQSSSSIFGSGDTPMVSSIVNKPYSVSKVIDAIIVGSSADLSSIYLYTSTLNSSDPVAGLHQFCQTSTFLNREGDRIYRELRSQDTGARMRGKLGQVYLTVDQSRVGTVIDDFTVNQRESK